ncbi:hypothetical protein [Seonamhaeicola maritimus]|uniref:hypothetical protein n=1 Tax=Seonamhaeicola maritimus TaxID=2591822 RepID=UPI001479166A|nr:hypothetical protein [Seonamhaeicola maritimus]
MLLTITLTITSLVIFNLLLLKFSVNKIKRSSNINKKPVILHPNASVDLGKQKLAPTGS